MLVDEEGNLRKDIQEAIDTIDTKLLALFREWGKQGTPLEIGAIGERVHHVVNGIISEVLMVKSLSRFTRVEYNH